MYRLYFTNLNFYSQFETNKFSKITEFAKMAGFECQIYGPGEKLVASYSPISGFTWSK